MTTAQQSRLRELLFWGVVVLLQSQVAARATCKLHLEGFASAQGIKYAELSCSDGTITASAHPVLLANFTRSFSGVQWSDVGECGAQEGLLADAVWRHLSTVPFCSVAECQLLSDSRHAGVPV
jgi:hypothetical protein